MKWLVALVLALAVCLGFATCGQKQPEHAADDGHGHGEGGEGGEHGEHHHHGEEAAGARYAEGKGITLLDETKKAIGLEFAEVEERILIPVVPLEAQVYRAAHEPSRPDGEQIGSAYATALVSPMLVEKLRRGEPATLMAHDKTYEARIWRIEPETKDAVNNVEVILQIPDPENTLRIGNFVPGSLTQSSAQQTALTVPRSAVLEAATGKFVFVQNGEYLLRTPVRTGAESSEYIEITDGLYAGDIVVSNPVEMLYLIELRATKGGGHSH
jgi:hypothetical protein